ncbi:MAG: glycosyltransferase [Candidatus Bathyarchaeota archaeon]|nr:glycosyltransferase [Candidatus Bathyarchaeota archaeon]
MGVLFGVPDLLVLAGNVRVSLDIADIMRDLGHEVKILYSDIRETSEQYFGLNRIRDYYPIKNLNLSDFEKVRWEDYYVEVLARLGLYEERPQYDLFFTNYDPLAYVNEDVDFPEVFYVNWPDRPRAPSCEVWANSWYTKQRIFKRWGVPSKVVNPPLKTERYDPSPSFSERDIDVIGFGQLYFQKGFKALTPLYERGWKTYVIGADVKQDRPKVTQVVTNPTFSQITQLLSRSKVFVHPKIGEHFGIAVVEAMASGCAAVCHRSGGPLTDIILPDERYGLLFSSEEELVRKVGHLLSNEKTWRHYSQLAVERAKRFSYDKIKDEVKGLMDRRVGHERGIL